MFERRTHMRRFEAGLCAFEFTGEPDPRLCELGVDVTGPEE
jgi:hypothetical protein